jgi:hypothetical protein
MSVASVPKREVGDKRLHMLMQNAGWTSHRPMMGHREMGVQRLLAGCTDDETVKLPSPLVADTVNCWRTVQSPGRKSVS